jgi:hypothetical protein
MAIGWRLIVERANRTEYYVARAPDLDTAIAAVRKICGMKDSVISIAPDGPKGTLWLTLADGQAAREVSRERLLGLPDD